MGGFVETLRSRLADELPGEDAQFLMAPVARLRTHDALLSASKRYQSAVLLYLFPRDGAWWTVLMKRPAYDGVHGGEISIPGGRLEPGENHTEAALREFVEETGVRVKNSQILGTLTELFIPTSCFFVQPFVAYATEQPSYHPDPLEVELLIELPLPDLVNDGTVKQGSFPTACGTRIKAPYFDVDGFQVWGATAMILSEFKTILSDVGVPSPTSPHWP